MVVDHNNPLSPDAAETDEVVQKTQQAAPTGMAQDVAVLNDEIEIMPGRRLQDYDRGPVKAYAARNQKDIKDTLFALVCENSLVPRMRSGPSLAGVVNTSLIRMVASGIVYWPPAKEQRYVFVFENTLGKPLTVPGHIAGQGWKQDLVMSAVIKPLTGVFTDLRNADLVHGCINPSNLFDGGRGGSVERVILGECVCLPPSYAQPSFYEPVERAMADPIAKGIGTAEDDMYAFGVTLAMLLCHKDFSDGVDGDEVLRQKIEMGSYSALTGNERFTGPILELLRGLLYDDRSQRWTLDEIQQWLDGQRLSPKQSAKKTKAARPIHFNNERYLRPALLAHDLQENQSEAAQLVENGQLSQWIERSLEDSAIRNNYEQVTEAALAESRGPGYWERYLARLSIALDPPAPIRYKKWSVHPDGIQYLLVETYCRKGDLAPFIDIIDQQLVLYWLNAQNDLRVDVGGLVTRFDSCRTFLKQKTIGFGIERCLYYLCRDCPCLSEKLKGFYVRNNEDLMGAFEKISSRPDRPELFIDRHIAAFVSVNDSKDIDPYLVELNSDEYHQRVWGNMRTLATIQKRSRLELFPGITAWLAEILDPVYERFHDRELRKTLKAKVEKLKSGGDISKIALLFDDERLRKKDFQDFNRAMIEYHQLREEYETIERKRQQPEQFGHQAGAEVAALVSGLLAGIVILSFAFLFFTEGALF